MILEKDVIYLNNVFDALNTYASVSNITILLKCIPTGPYSAHVVVKLAGKMARRDYGLT